jgi:hypothetical protein
MKLNGPITTANSLQQEKLPGTIREPRDFQPLFNEPQHHGTERGRQFNLLLRLAIRPRHDGHLHAPDQTFMSGTGGCQPAECHSAGLSSRG